jgi:hypothetical protein
MTEQPRLAADKPTSQTEAIDTTSDNPATATAAAASSADPRTGLRAVVALHRLAEALEAVQVDNARRRGWSWQEIAGALGVSKQAVHKKHANRPSMLPSREE